MIKQSLKDDTHYPPIDQTLKEEVKASAKLQAFITVAYREKLVDVNEIESRICNTLDSIPKRELMDYPKDKYARFIAYTYEHY